MAPYSRGRLSRTYVPTVALCLFYIFIIPFYILHHVFHSPTDLANVSADVSADVSPLLGRNMVEGHRLDPR